MFLQLLPQMHQQIYSLVITQRWCIHFFRSESVINLFNGIGDKQKNTRDEILQGEVDDLLKRVEVLRKFVHIALPFFKASEFLTHTQLQYRQCACEALEQFEAEGLATNF